MSSSRSLIRSEYFFLKGANLSLTCGSTVDIRLMEEQKIIWRLNRKPLLLPEPILVTRSLSLSN